MEGLATQLKGEMNESSSKNNIQDIILREQRIGDILRESDLKPVTSIMLRSTISIGHLEDIGIQKALIRDPEVWKNLIELGWNPIDQESYLWFLS